ncbi:MAG: orotidine-5'-phosphate decarboxylase [Clostridiales Family XIII bacterium]|nr:orotidine-5'-phosphate decarboxylase [Clostridiales Family XIII bacterium]
MFGLDRLIDRIDELASPISVGLDPLLSMMPVHLSREMFGEYGDTPRAVSEMFFLYNMAIIDAVADIVPAVKPQIAMYERYGVDGVEAYVRTCEYAAGKGLYVIGDIKRGDISSTAEAYADHLAGAEIGLERVDLWHEDAITVNPYLGSDGIRPFTRACREAGKAIFVLVKTSNMSSRELQDVRIGGKMMYEKVADLVELWGAELVGERGYSAVGAVVGATHPDVGRALREAHPGMFFLVPGYGAQGARAEDLADFFDAEGRGCIVNSSRGVIAAWQRSAEAADEAVAAPDAKRSLSLVSASARAAALTMADDLRSHILT